MTSQLSSLRLTFTQIYKNTLQGLFNCEGMGHTKIAFWVLKFFPTGIHLLTSRRPTGKQLLSESSNQDQTPDFMAQNFQYVNLDISHSPEEYARLLVGGKSFIDHECVPVIMTYWSSKREKPKTTLNYFAMTAIGFCLSSKCFLLV